MSTFYQGLLSALVPALIVSMLTAYVTVKLATKQFYSQKWWEKKAESYSRIIEELSYQQYYYGVLFDESIGAKNLDEDEFNSLKENYKSSKQLIMKAYASGAYIISEKTIKSLKDFVKEIEKEEYDCHFSVNYDRWYGATKECISVIREEAKKELKSK